MRLIASNENQTYEQFKAGAAPDPRDSIGEIAGARAVVYSIHFEPGEFALLRYGIGHFDRRIGRIVGPYPASAMPHPWCPENRAAPQAPAGYGAPVRCAPKKLARPSYLRAI